MRHLLMPLFGAFLLIGMAAEAATGLWRTIDDSTGEPRSIVAIDDREGVLTGRIVELIDPPEPDPVCEQCPGDKRNAPVEGLEILWGFESSRRAGEWTGGELLDPENGRVYRGRLRVQDEGDRLEVRGFIGSPMFGRSQLWERAPTFEAQ
jgi:uncharacterized protein (DUF2147 family)